jgi:hypothetical protein
MIQRAVAYVAEYESKKAKSKLKKIAGGKA